MEYPYDVPDYAHMAMESSEFHPSSGINAEWPLRPGTQSPATSFDMGNGFVNATAALDPGLIIDCSYDDLFSFLCGINGSSPVVKNYTGNSCVASTMTGADLNLPSITIAVLNQTRTIT
ncbi:hypothetical protein WCV48_31050, partial [Klebsiella pneumoniae]|uniref:hypothetical protein n=1 Tax=Klebsiella pneumoniae TaxID=573 RepID=UPI003015A94C